MGLHSDVESLEFVLLTPWQQQEITHIAHKLHLVTRFRFYYLNLFAQDEQLVRKTECIIQAREEYSENYSCHFSYILVKKVTRSCLMLLPQGHFTFLIDFPALAIGQKMVIT